MIMSSARQGSVPIEDARTNLSLFTYSLISALSVGASIGEQPGHNHREGLSEYVENTAEPFTLAV